MKYLKSLKAALKAAAKEAGVAMPPITHVEESKAFSQVEDGKTYHYPHIVNFNIECWNTLKFSLRIKDGKFIPEGTDLSGKGYTEKLLVKMAIDDKLKQQEFLMRHIAEKAGLEYDGGDERLHAEMIHTYSSAFSKKEYAAMEKDIAGYSEMGAGFEVHAWNDCSGYEYWTLKQQEDNYIQVTAWITDAFKANPIELKKAVDRALSHFQKYERE